MRRSSTAPAWRAGENPRTTYIDNASITLLHTGARSGGNLFRKGLRFERPSNVASTSRLLRGKTPEAQTRTEDFYQLIRRCDHTQRQTRKLYNDLRNRSRSIRGDLTEISDRLQIMRSMPDLTVSAEELEEFVTNVLSQPKLRPGDATIKTSLSGGGSLQSIFPLRDWKDGGRMKKRSASR